MSRRLLVALALALFYAAVLYSENGCSGNWGGSPMLGAVPPEVELEGRIVDAGSGERVSGAEVTAVQGRAGITVPASAGGYAVAGLQPGEVTISAQAPGYEPLTTVVSVRKGHNIFHLRMVRASRGGPG